jgi:hypothetical protein
MKVRFFSVASSSIALIAFAAICWAGLQWSCLGPLPVERLAMTVGGDPCYGIIHPQPCEHNIGCTEYPGTGVYYTRVGTGSKQEFCVDRVANNLPGAGKTTCGPKTTSDCYYVYSCSDPACTNCGYPVTETTISEVTVGGDDCTVAGG